MCFSNAPRCLLSVIAACRDALIHVENPVGQRNAYPAEIQPAICKFTTVDVLSGQAARDVVLVQDEPLPVCSLRMGADQEAITSGAR